MLSKLKRIPQGGKVRTMKTRRSRKEKPAGQTPQDRPGTEQSELSSPPAPSGLMDRDFVPSDFARVGWATTNAEGIILDANPALAELLGDARNNLIGSGITQYVDLNPITYSILT